MPPPCLVTPSRRPPHLHLPNTLTPPNMPRRAKKVAQAAIAASGHDVDMQPAANDAPFEPAAEVDAPAPPPAKKPKNRSALSKVKGRKGAMAVFNALPIDLIFDVRDFRGFPFFIDLTLDRFPSSRRSRRTSTRATSTSSAAPARSSARSSRARTARLFGRRRALASVFPSSLCP